MHSTPTWETEYNMHIAHHWLADRSSDLVTYKMTLIIVDLSAGVSQSVGALCLSSWALGPGPGHSRPSRRAQLEAVKLFYDAY